MSAGLAAASRSMLRCAVRYCPQVLESIGNTFDSISNENTTFSDMIKVKAVSITHAKSGGSAADRNGMRSGRIDAV